MLYMYIHIYIYIYVYTYIHIHVYMSPRLVAGDHVVAGRQALDALADALHDAGGLVI